MCICIEHSTSTSLLTSIKTNAQNSVIQSDRLEIAGIIQRSKLAILARRCPIGCRLQLMQHTKEGAWQYDPYERAPYCDATAMMTNTARL
jgi:hypothetical protein